MADAMDYAEGGLSCRGRLERGALLQNGLFPLPGDGLFPLPGDKPHYPRDRAVDIEHVRLDISLDLDAKRISGSVAHTFSALNDGLSAIELDAVELEIAGVRLAGGAALGHSLADGRLRIELDRPRAGGGQGAVVVAFTRSPSRRS